MKKNQIKHIRGIANRLPPVYEQCVSGGTLVDDKFVPNVYTVQVNHQRRLRLAYEKLGMSGIMSYLESISKLQKERNEKALGDNGNQSVDVLPILPDSVGDSDTVQAQDQVSDGV
jgi:hypothetical protein